MRFWRCRRKFQDRADAATREAELSRKRLAEAHHEIIAPLSAASSRNQFSDIIRETLIEGRRKGKAST